MRFLKVSTLAIPTLAMTFILAFVVATSYAVPLSINELPYDSVSATKRLSLGHVEGSNTSSDKFKLDTDGTQHRHYPVEQLTPRDVSQQGDIKQRAGLPPKSKNKNKNTGKGQSSSVIFKRTGRKTKGPSRSPHEKNPEDEELKKADLGREPWPWRR
jgi:hypothetical protein